MKSIIIHVGPGKCASTAIQKELRNPISDMTGRFGFSMIAPSMIGALCQRQFEADAIESIRKVVTDCLYENGTAIISHEALFSSLIALERITKLASDMADNVLVIGYSRRQSDFVRSAYSQWHFWSSERSHETFHVLKENDLDPMLFTGIERHLIATLLTDFHSARQRNGQIILDWNSRYSTIDAFSNVNNARLEVGRIPTTKDRFSIISDFYKKCGFDVQDNIGLDREKVNSAHNSYLVEAVNIAVVSGVTMPTKMAAQKLYSDVSSKMPPHPDLASPLLDALSAAIDTYWIQSNLEFCEKYEMPADYFRPKRQIILNDAMNIVRTEADSRRENPNYMSQYHKAIILQLMEFLRKGIDDQRLWQITVMALAYPTIARHKRAVSH